MLLALALILTLLGVEYYYTEGVLETVKGFGFALLASLFAALFVSEDVVETGLRAIVTIVIVGLVLLWFDGPILASAYAVWVVAFMSIANNLRTY